MKSAHLSNSWYRFLVVWTLVALATLLDIPFHTHIAPTNLAMIYLVAVVISAAYLGRGPAILASILSVLAFDFFFVPPFLTLHVDDTEYLITFAGLLGVGLVISELTVRAREQAREASEREKETAAIYALSHDLGSAEDIADVNRALAQHIRQVFQSEARLDISENQAERQPSHPWKFPLRGSQGILGFLEIQPPNLQRLPSPAEQRLFEAFAIQAAQAIERLRLAARARQVQVMQETERLQTALLNSISHDLRTPLVSITGSLSTLREDNIALDSELHSNLVETAYQEAIRLNRLVTNLLNMTRLEAGAMKVVKQPEDVQDAIGAALEPLAERLTCRQVQIRVPSEMPLVPMDFALMVQVLVNLVDNAIKYSPEGSPIDIQASWDPQEATIRVEDRGMGIPSQDLGRVFDKFYRVQDMNPLRRPSTGLGLSICKGIVEAHGGRIWAENRPGGGTSIQIALPLEGG